jgi:hypothetical protein
MASVTAISVDKEENIIANLTNRLHPEFSVVSTVVLFLQRGTQEDAHGVIETETSLAQGAPALGLVPLEEHAGDIYA